MSNVEIDEDALFDSAVSDEATDNPVVTEQTEKTEQAATEQADETATTEAETERAADDTGGRVPAFRLREEAEARRRLETDLANERAERAALKQRLEALERPAPKAEPTKQEDEPDPLLNPKEYREFIERRIEERILNERREESLLRARETNQSEFDEAYAAAQKAFDPALKARMQSSRDPGRTLLEWHRENKVKAEVGADPNAWLEKKLEERLKDPAFLAKAVELARGSAQPQQQSNGRPRVDLPPSLNGASRSNAALRSSQTDLSDDALWDETTA